MASVNKVILIGNLGADPEVRQAGSSTVANLRLATSETWNDRDGVRQERTEWHSVSVWGKQAELCGQFLSKGRSVYVEGRLQSREYVDKEGITRKVWEVVASSVTFLGSRTEGQQQRPAQPQGPRWGDQPQQSGSRWDNSGGGYARGDDPTPF